MQAILQAARELEAGRPVALVIVTEVRGSTPRSSGSRMVVLENGATVGTIGGGAVEHRAIAAALEALRTGSPTRLDIHLTRDLGMCCGGQMRIHIEPLFPAAPFLLYGAGHVAHALAPMLATLGFRVHVIDDRDELNTPERFSCARLVEDPRRHAASLRPDPQRYVLIVTHDHALDLDLCRTLLPIPHAWIGMIGSRAKVAKFRVRLRAAGLPDAQIEALRAPVGLDIGAETPAEIAVAIAAELVWHRRGLSGSCTPLAG